MAARDLIGILTPMIADAVDPMRTPTALARTVGTAEAGIVLTRAHHPVPLPGLPTHPLLAAGSNVLSAATVALTRRTNAAFLCPVDPTPAGDSHVRITALACPAEPPDYLTAVVLVSRPGDLHGLTRRELDILGLMVEGWPDCRIAAALGSSGPDVHTHREHILAKLGAATRALATVRAHRLGLYTPRPLNGIPR
jgi:DNA-binding CsgD family transcriptional regulator